MNFGSVVVGVKLLFVNKYNNKYKYKFKKNKAKINSNFKQVKTESFPIIHVKIFIKLNYCCSFYDEKDSST